MLPIKTVNEPYHASKWLSVALLIDEEELKALFKALGDFYIFTVGTINQRGEGLVSHEAFLSGYANYMHCLKTGRIPEDSSYRTLFGSVMTVLPDQLYALHVGTDKQLIRIAKPVVQMQVHNLGYSSADKKFHSMVFGKDSILWGLQFSYPQLYEDSHTHAVHKVEMNAEFPNTALFRAIQKWTREYTFPTPFIVDEKKLNVPMRLGKNCFTWINAHPQLKSKGISVLV